jgi:hypothetical protein
LTKGAGEGSVWTGNNLKREEKFRKEFRKIGRI